MTTRFAPLFAVVIMVGVPVLLVACRDAGPPPVAPQTEPTAGSSGVKAQAVSVSPVAVVSAQETPVGPSAPITPMVDPPVAAEPKPIAAAECRAIVKRSEAGFRSALAGTKHTCSADADCTRVHATCLPGCAGNAFTAKDKDTYAKLAKAPLAECDKFDAGLCMVSLALPMPSCPQYLPRCEHDVCVSKQR